MTSKLNLFANAMSMDERTWRKHANPWSVYSRFSLFPLMAVSFWSRAWIDYWSLIPVGLTLFWVWYNPRAFGEVKNIDSWASKGVMGEKLYLSIPKSKISNHHLSMIRILGVLTSLGLGLFIYGLITLNFWATLFGMSVSMITKAWLVDRMVWIYESYNKSDPDRRS